MVVSLDTGLLGCQAPKVASRPDNEWSKPCGKKGSGVKYDSVETLFEKLELNPK